MLSSRLEEMQDNKRASEKTRACATRVRGWRRSMIVAGEKFCEKFDHNQELTLTREPHLAISSTSASKFNLMNPTLEMTRLRLESKFERVLAFRRQSFNGRYTHNACTRSPPPSSSWSASPSAELPLELSVVDHRRRQAIIPKAACPLLAISILLSIFSLTFAAVSFASAPLAAVASDFQQPLAGQPFAAVQSNENHKQWAPHFEIAGTSGQVISKKSSYDQVSSADLPAEFRGNDEGATINEGGNDSTNEQSKLAKLCQQTSSVLASVLPAPFGGHKRSILCQFFGQVPFTRKQVGAKLSKQLQKQQHPHHPLSQQQAPHSEQADSTMAMIQSQLEQHQPVTMIASNRHPIEIVLEQQQRQHHNQLMLANPRYPSMHRMPTNLPLNALQTDLKSSASVLDYAYQQRVEAPLSMRQAKVLPSAISKSESTKSSKFSKPITATSFKPIQFQTQITSKPTMSTSGWRIFNQTLESTSPQPPVVLNGTRGAPNSALTDGSLSGDSGIGFSRNQSNTDGIRQVSSKNTAPSATPKTRPIATDLTATVSAQQNQADLPRHSSSPIWSESLNIGSAQLLVMGRPPSFSSQSHGRLQVGSSASNNTSSIVEDQQQMVNIGKRTEALKSTTRSADFRINDPSDLPEVRTIEVSAQNSSSGHLSASSTGGNLAGIPGNGTSSGSLVGDAASIPKPASDLRQVQKREELVIASINNLTRIAFGNQLRDTVKVINKLIDQHSDLFNANKKARSGIDPMLTSESGRQQTVNGLNSDSKLSPAKKGYPSKNIEPAGDSTGSKGGLMNGLSSGNGQVSATTANSRSRQKQIPVQTNVRATTRSGQFKSTKKPKKQSIPSAASARVLQQSSEAEKQAESSEKANSSGFSSREIATSQTRSLTKEVSDLSRQPVASNRSNSGRPGERKFGGTSQQGDLQRLHGHTVSRALSFGSSSSIAPAGLINPFDSDPAIPAVNLDDIHRDKTPWKLSSGHFSSTTKAIPRAVASSYTATSRHDRKAQSAGRAVNGVTNYPWLLPDKLTYHSDSLIGFPATTKDDERKPSTGADMLKKWTTTRKAPMQLGMGMSGKQALVLNRLDNTKMDSLTTLKMSLNAESVATTSDVPMWSAMHKPSSSKQSRWIPTSATMKSSSTTTKMPATTTVTTSTTPIPSTTPAATTTSTTASSTKRLSEIDLEASQTTLSLPLASSPARESLTQNDLNEARASDSISRYTTHWNDANELLATTQKRFIQHQPMPQIAQTGEYFSAETISNWPERYQTMLESSKPTTTASFGETTRRNGEPYDNEMMRSTVIATRHRLPTTMDALPREATNGRTTLTEMATTLSGVTILPANHKLTSAATTTQQQLGTDIAGNAVPIFEQTNGPMFQASSNSPAYTLVGPLTSGSTVADADRADSMVQPHQSASGENSDSNDEAGKFPRILDDLDATAGAETGSNIGLSNGLKPPYLEQHEEPETIISWYNHSANSNGPQVSKKLYELLVPTTQSFVGPQNPLNQRRFNLSALKFLAQNMLPNPKNHRIKGVNESSTSGEEEAAIKASADSSVNQTNSERLFDILGGSLPPTYQDLLFNNTHLSGGNKSLLIGNGNSNSSKSVFGKASNLLSDLRQLEHKRAAAILAAIRYQVPSPLVRPWDLATDGHAMSELAGVRDRLDAGQMTGDFSERDYLRDNFLLGQLSNSIRSALFKQRLIPRSELEARLKLSAGVDRSSSSQNLLNIGGESERRSDSTNTEPIRLSLESFPYSVGDSYDAIQDAPKRDEVSLSEYLSTGNLLPVKVGARNLLPSARSWIDRLLLGGSRDEQVPQNKSGDYDLIDLSASTRSPLTDENEPIPLSYPKYIRLADYKSWNDPKGSESSSKIPMQKQQLPSSAVAARLKANRARIGGSLNGTAVNKDGEADLGTFKTSDTRADSIGQQLDKKETGFSCLEGQMGFYPDTESACQTFYHCSSTGHLLTFSCPQQTRFDEKSLKCGPWFEVPCDLGRAKQKRLLV